MTVAGGGNTFRNCVFGSTSVARSGEHSFVGFKSGCYRATFEDCIFYSQIDTDSPRFLYAGRAAAGFMPSGPQFFRNCQFIAWDSDHTTKAAYLFLQGAQGISTAFWAFDQNCAAYGVEDICPEQSESQVYWAHNTITLSHTGDNDNKVTGLAQNPNAS